MHLMLQQDEPDDYVIATGESSSLEEFVAVAFAVADLDWQDHVVIDKSLLRPTDLAAGKGNSIKAKEKFGWQAKYKMSDIVKMMIEVRLNRIL
jgi:GDPmannose 4,6-dehydratase